MDGFLTDLRQALRSLRRNARLTTFVVLSLALAVGANLALFNLIGATMLRPLPVSEPGRLLSIFTRQDASPAAFQVSLPNFEDFRGLEDVFSDLSAYRPQTVRLSGDGEAEVAVADIVSGNYFGTLGLEPAVGRFFRPEEDSLPGAHPVAVLSEKLWRSRWGGDPTTVGRSVTINDHPFTIIGVAPLGYSGLHVHGGPDLFVPLAMYAEVLTGAAREWFLRREALLLFVVGRLRDGVDSEQARLRIEAFGAQLRAEHPLENEGFNALVVPTSQAWIHPNLRSRFEGFSRAAFIIVACLLLMSCTSAATLLIIRALDRESEFAIQAALGAGRGRVFRRQLCEGLLLSVAAGGVGLLLAVWLRRVLWSLAPRMVNHNLDVGIDGRVAAFGLLLTLVPGLFLALVTTMQVGRPGVSGNLRSQGPTASARKPRSLRSLLAVAQVAISMVALSASLFFVWKLESLRGIDPGFRTQDMLVMELDVGSVGYDEARGQSFFGELVDRLSALPGVRGVALGRALLLSGGALRFGVEVVGEERQGESRPAVMTDVVSEGYFETVGMPVLEGRGFDSSDRPGSLGVAVVNETFARLFVAQRGAIGRRLRLESREGEVEVVGVVRDASYLEPGAPLQPYLYLPLTQVFSPGMTVYVRFEGERQRVIPALRRTVREAEPRLPIRNLQEMSQVVAQALWMPRFMALLVSLFAGVAVVLACVGLYGVMAFSVRRSRREVGIRLSLGAQRREVISLFLFRGAALVLIGMGVGAMAWLALLPKVSELIDRSDGRTLWPLVAAGSVLAVVAGIANYLPVRKAGSLAPSTLVRPE